MANVSILLSGSLARQFGRRHLYDLDSGTSNEAFSALRCTIEGFEQFIRCQAKKGIRYAIFRNRENISDDNFALKGTTELRIVPVIEGSKRAGALQTIVGAVLVVAGIWISGASWGGASTVGGAMANAGIAMIAGGVIQMLSPQVKKNESSETQAPNYAFGGAVNTTAAGHIVSVGYGERLIGGAIISAGIYAEDQA